jgi:hypothetical protein
MTGPQPLPPDVTLRVEICVPPPQLFEHADQFVHDEKRQLLEHVTPLLHDRCWMKSKLPHAGTDDSNPGGRVKRTRVCVPEPHGVSQRDHSLQSDTGQGSAEVGAGQLATD